MDGLISWGGMTGRKGRRIRGKEEKVGRQVETEGPTSGERG